MKSRWRSVALILLVLCFSAGVNLTQRRLSAMDLRKTSLEAYMYVPSGKFLEPLTLGFNQLVADYFWIKTISYFADQLKAGGDYPWLFHILDLVTTLDPHFRWPYYFGGIILSLEAKQVEQSNIILKRAMQYHPEVWKFPFYIGFNYWHHLNDPATAASYIEIAAKLPGAPLYLRTFPATLYSKAGKNDTAIIFLEEMQETVQDKAMRQRIERKIRKLKRK